MDKVGATASRKRLSVTPLPPLGALLDQISLRVTTKRLAKRDVRYELRVEHAASQTTWRRSRSFDEYKAFQTQLLEMLRLGHFCQAECPWLYSFVKSYFPSSVTLFGLGKHSDCAVEKRRGALEHLLLSLQKFVVNRQNVAACSIVAGNVTQLVADFIIGDVSDKRHPLNGVSPCSSLRDSVCSSTSVTSVTSVTSDEGDELADEPEDAGVCALCNLSLETDTSEADSETSSFHSSNSSHSNGSFGTSSSHRSSVQSYTTTLSCGHHFHDECIISKLNDEMRCPTCHAKVDGF
ncbi:hypothetical protein JM18_009612 [Phytophthora kernoviae]|uniref:RING-type domain-containing protein n=2 Tax=Phytophthora kernoviae TaxID=325452 RepID=A0A921V3B3_9STRA|nr:hypothetical protein G195_010239 [Phytophthora kernoviae 00238/432]KAG2502478.1 hypothetical protein JM18_009612 [Phytophthora kernoviae]